jgi:predicted enzyme related to lactoylglutathione lyase
MIKNPVIWFEIYVQDMPRAKAFYEAVFQFKLSRLHSHEIEMWGFPMEKDGPGVTGSLVKMNGVSSGGGTLVYFSCKDCAVEAARVLEYGGSVHREKMPIGQYGFIVLAVDTEGNMIGLHSMQ